MLDFGRETTSHPVISREREWLVTNGIGGYATGTINGTLTRVYHGLLVAALEPPLGRTVLLSKLDETVTYGDREYYLFTNQWSPQVINPQGYHHIERFRLEGTIPAWTFAIGDARLEKRVWMQHGENTTYVQYRYVQGSQPLTLRVKAMVNYKDSHSVVQEQEWEMATETLPDGVKITAYEGAFPFYLRTTGCTYEPEREWYRRYYLEVERMRGLDDRTDHMHIGDFVLTMQPGASLGFIASTRPDASLDLETAYNAAQARERELVIRAGMSTAPEWIQQLVLAADQFIVERATQEQPGGRSIMAGYHWFSDWGRDTMIALPGLTLTTQRADEGARILQTFAQYIDQGMLPNRFPDVGDEPEYNTVDATLWYFEAVRQVYAATLDTQLLGDLFVYLESIIEWHQKGTRYNIHMDKSDHLLYAGEEGVQLTWMDAKIGDWVVTPRTGKAVEINALWYNALRIMADFARVLGETTADEYEHLASRVQKSFARFWNEEAGYCYDVLDTPNGDDASLRPNQLFAVSLEYSPLTADQQRAVVQVCGQKLLTSMGMRTLSPDHADYRGDYGGNPYERDSRYHQGTVWPWLIGAYVAAHLRVHKDPDTAAAFLEPFRHHLRDACVGSISEVAQGDPPFLPRAAIAQAWSVAEVLRAWKLVQDVAGTR